MVLILSGDSAVKKSQTPEPPTFYKQYKVHFVKNFSYGGPGRKIRNCSIKEYSFSRAMTSPFSSKNPPPGPISNYPTRPCSPKTEGTYSLHVSLHYVKLQLFSYLKGAIGLRICPPAVWWIANREGTWFRNKSRLLQGLFRRWIWNYDYLNYETVTQNIQFEYTCGQKVSSLLKSRNFTSHDYA